MSDPILSAAAEKMQNAVEHLRDVFTRLNVGRANPALVEDLPVTAYGSTSPLKSLGSVSTPDASSIVISPWDRSIIADVEKAILAANLGITPQSDGVIIRISIPRPTEEKRRELAKVVREEAERARIAVRTARQDVHTRVKEGLKDDSLTEDDERGLEKKLQELVDRTNAEIEELAKKKEAELLTV